MKHDARRNIVQLFLTILSNALDSNEPSCSLNKVVILCCSSTQHHWSLITLLNNSNMILNRVSLLPMGNLFIFHQSRLCIGLEIIWIIIIFINIQYHLWGQLPPLLCLLVLWNRHFAFGDTRRWVKNYKVIVGTPCNKHYYVFHQKNI